ncbi:MAG TPA: hypothetical protein DCX27_19665 [Balneola sp.]|nr:hypothetical protein [Balneola sp.]
MKTKRVIGIVSQFSNKSKREFGSFGSYSIGLYKEGSPGYYWPQTVPHVSWFDFSHPICQTRHLIKQGALVNIRRK